jgi:hypothetical protein
MIIFPLMTPWVWFQILTAFSLDASAVTPQFRGP